MKTLISARFATYSLLVILSVIILFHALVLAGIIPFDIVWGGRLETASDMRAFETVSIIINLLMLATILLHAGIWNGRVSQKVTRAVLWVMAGLFLVNTIGNFFPLNDLERWVFTPLTFLLSLCSLRLALGDRATKIQATPQQPEVTL